MKRRRAIVASSETLPLVRKVAVKQSDGSLSADRTIGAVFTDIVDAERSGATGYSLDQFIDSYLKFMSETPFVYVGNEEPDNSHIKIWIDTNTPQNNF